MSENRYPYGPVQSTGTVADRWHPYTGTAGLYNRPAVPVSYGSAAAALGQIHDCTDRDCSDWGPSDWLVEEKCGESIPGDGPRVPAGQYKGERYIMRDPVRYSEVPEIQAALAEDYARYGEHTGCYRCECYICGKVFYAGMPHAVLCSERCNQDATLQRRKEARLPERIRTCLMCGVEFQAKRKDTRYCSAACKQKAYRRRVTACVTRENPK